MKLVNTTYLVPCIGHLKIASTDDIAMLKMQLPHSGVELPITKIFFDCEDRWAVAREEGDRTQAVLRREEHGMPKRSDPLPSKECSGRSFEGKMGEIERMGNVWVANPRSSLVHSNITQ